MSGFAHTHADFSNNLAHAKETLLAAVRDIEQLKASVEAGAPAALEQRITALEHQISGITEALKAAGAGAGL